MLPVHLRADRRVFSAAIGSRVDSELSPFRNQGLMNVIALRAFASNDDTEYTVTLVMNIPEDEANPVIASVAWGDPRVRHLLAGRSAICAPKICAQIFAIDGDPRSEVFLSWRLQHAS
jgi:hypothetical protein